jgi:hypothetical protein
MALPVLLGANVDPVWEDPNYPLRLAQQVDASGLDFITIQDHPYQSAFYDAWTLLTFLAARTKHVTLVPTVANLLLRPPARIDDAASAAGRDPATMRKVYNVGGMIGPESPEPFQGSVRQWVGQLVTIVREHGMNGFTFWPNDDREQQLAIFAAEVAPTVRAAFPISA